jgi:hypothetical protein
MPIATDGAFIIQTFFRKSRDRVAGRQHRKAITENDVRFFEQFRAKGPKKRISASDYGRRRIGNRVQIPSGSAAVMDDEGPKKPLFRKEW